MTQTDFKRALSAIHARLERIERLLTEHQAAPELFTPDAAARALSVSRKTVHRMKASRKLRTVPIGRRWRVPRSEVVRLSTPKPLPTRQQRLAPTESPREMYERGMAKLRKGR